MNVLVIVNDSLRYDYMGCYGNKQVKTPNMDALAADATVFDNSWAEGLPTVPVRTAWFTGRFTLPFRGWQRLEPTDQVLAEILWDKGYTSALFTDAYHLHKPSFAFERGFDYVHFIRGQEGDPYIVDKSIKVDAEPFHKDDGKDTKTISMLEQHLRNRHTWKSDEDCFAAQVARGATEWLERQKKRDNLFMWVDMFDPHEPWDPLPPYDSMYKNPNYKGKDIVFPIPRYLEGYLEDDEIQNIRDLYAGKVTQTDKWDGMLLDKIKELGMWDNTLIIFTSDHGEPFGEHGYVKKAYPYPYVEEVKIPLIIRLPDGTGAGKRIAAANETPDLFSSILDFLSIRQPRKTHGQSLIPLITGEKESLGRDYIYIGRFKQSWRIQNDEWCHIQFFVDNKPEELYHISEDPEEQKNVIEEHPDVAEKLKAKMEEWMSSIR